MNIVYDKRKIGILLNDFYNCTDLSISFYDSKYNLIAEADDNVEYCSEIRKTSLGYKQCMNSDKNNFLRTEQERRTIIYTCNAGITETVTPVLYEKKIIGFIIVGRFRDANMVYSNPNDVCKNAAKFSIDKEILTKLYNKLPIASNKKLQSTIKLVNIYIQQIWKDGLIKVSKDNVLSSIEEYIDENIKEKITVDEICEKFFFSKNTLYSIFEKTYGLTFGEYITQRRIFRAKDLLTSSDMPITDIAYNVGIKDYNYFITVFKKICGLTPLVFRKTYKVQKFI